MAAEIQQARGIQAVLKPGKGGEFEITADDRLIFSKKAQGRFPELEEVLAKLSVAS